MTHGAHVRRMEPGFSNGSADQLATNAKEARMPTLRRFPWLRRAFLRRALTAMLARGVAVASMKEVQTAIHVPTFIAAQHSGGPVPNKRLTLPPAQRTAPAECLGATHGVPIPALMFPLTSL